MTARIRIEYTSIVQMKSGMRIQLIPAARMLWIVQRKLIAPSSDEIATRCRDRIQRSCPEPGENAFSESGGELYPTPPAAPPPPPERRRMPIPPQQEKHDDAAFSAR